MGRTACTEPQCLYNSALYLYLYLYSPYGPYGLYRASVPVQGSTLPYYYIGTWWKNLLYFLTKIVFSYHIIYIYIYILSFIILHKTIVVYWHHRMWNCQSSIYNTVKHIYCTGLFKLIVGVQLSSGNCHQILETPAIWQFHSKVLCTVSRDRVRVCPGTEGTDLHRHWNRHRRHAERTGLSCWCL